LVFASCCIKFLLFFLFFFFLFSFPSYIVFLLFIALIFHISKILYLNKYDTYLLWQPAENCCYRFAQFSQKLQILVSFIKPTQTHRTMMSAYCHTWTYSDWAWVISYVLRSVTLVFGTSLRDRPIGFKPAGGHRSARSCHSSLFLWDNSCSCAELLYTVYIEWIYS